MLCLLHGKRVPLRMYTQRNFSYWQKYNKFMLVQLVGDLGVIYLLKSFRGLI